MAEYELNPFTKQMERVDAKVPVVPAVTVTGTIGLKEEFVRADATGGAIVLTLPASVAAIQGKQYEISKIDSSVNTVTITAAGTDTINGAATSIISFQYSTAHIVCNGDGTWSII